jgi:hypothetical protein
MIALRLKSNLRRAEKFAPRGAEHSSPSSPDIPRIIVGNNKSEENDGKVWTPLGDEVNSRHLESVRIALTASGAV